MSSLLKWEKGGFKSPLARARGLGSAKSGSKTWMAERVSSVAMVFLGIWFMWAVIAHHDMAYTEAMLWLSKPINAVLMILFILVSFYHAVLGVQVVIEDYIHTEWFKMIKLISVRLVYAALAVAAVFSVLQIAL